MQPRPRHLAREERERVLEKLKELLWEREEVFLALLHGSFSEGGPFRDVDIALYVDTGKLAGQGFRDYEVEQSVRLNMALGVPVDVRVLNDAPVSFRYHALKGLVLVVRDPHVLDELRARTWDEYLDFAPFARRYLREVLGG